MARKNVSELQASVTPHTSVNRLVKAVCCRCGRGGHQPDKCRFKQAKCLSCGKVGHIQRVCRTSQKPDRSILKKPTNHKPQSIKQIIEKEEDPVERLIGEGNNPIQMTIYIEGKPVLMDLDTGAAVSYLGYTIDEDGLHPTEEKLQAIRDAPSPKNVTQLKSYLGLLSYYGRFLPNLSNVLFFLYRLLRKQTPWKWSITEEETFQNSKKLLMSSNLLLHFDPSLELILACDASNYGIGAVLAHRLPDGAEKPVGFASRTLTETEKRYSQLKKRRISLYFWNKKIPLVSIWTIFHTVYRQSTTEITLL